MSKTNFHTTTPTQFVEEKGIKFAYRRFGQEAGRPLVFFQHFNGTMENWDPILTNRLAQDRAVVLFDNTGIGRSSNETPDSMEAMASDAIAFIRTLNVEQVDLFGFSLGGMVAQQVALDAPSLVDRLILVGTGPRGGEGIGTFTKEVTEIVTRPNTTQAQRVLELFFAKSATSQAAGKAWLERISERQIDREPENKAQVAQAQLAALRGWGEYRGKRYETLAKIPNPTLIANGQTDIMVPTVNSYILQQHLPNAQLLLYPDSGHGAHFQYSAHFAEIASIFLGAN